MKDNSTFDLPIGYWQLEQVLRKFSGTFSFCPRNRIFFKITGNKHSAAYVLECLLDLMGSKDAYLSGWHRAKMEGRIHGCLFLTDDDLSSLLGMPRCEHVLQKLRKLNFIAYKRTKTQFSPKFGRRIYLKLNVITNACEKEYKFMLDKFKSNSSNLMCKSRASRARDFDLYSYHDVLTKRVERVYMQSESEFLKLLTKFNKGETSHSEFRNDLAKLDTGGNIGAPTCTEPATIEWYVPTYEPPIEHARKRLHETAALFAKTNHGHGKAVWYGQGIPRDSFVSGIVNGRVDLFTLQFIGVALVLRPKLKEHFNIKDLLKTNQNLDSLFAGICEVWEQDSLYTGELTNNQHPNTLIINELKSIGWLEQKVKYRYVSGKKLLARWFNENPDYCDISFLQRLCIYGKMFPDAKEHIKMFAPLQDENKTVPSAIECLNKLTAQQRKLYTAMYPNTFPEILAQANAFI